MRFADIIDPLNWRWPPRPDARLRSQAVRIAYKAKLLSQAPIPDASVSELLLREVQRTVDASLDGLKNLEMKAVSQIGFAGTIVAIFGAFGNHRYFWWVAIPLGLWRLLNCRACLGGQN